MIWSRSGSGQYSVKEGYQSLYDGKNIAHERKFKLCWHDVVLPKVGVFFWLALQNRILTSDRLQRLHIIDSFLCVLCGKEWENATHLLLSCDFAHDFWMRVLVRLGCYGPFPSSLS